MSDDALLQQAADAVASADALLVTAGAGLGVDSGLPDFRGSHGFWRAYPPYQRLGLDFVALANPVWFRSDPELAWGFYGHRLQLYRASQPHAGFHLLRSWGDRMRHGLFVFTSNVDGHFQRAGFDPGRVVECHGAIDWMQCTRSCGVGLFPADPSTVAVDEATMRARPPLPSCPRCGALARPNILMFGDFEWDGSRTADQAARLEDWLRQVAGPGLVIVECGAGTAIPTVRHTSEKMALSSGGVLIRINPREPTTSRHTQTLRHVDLSLGALEGIRAVDSRLPRR